MIIELELIPFPADESLIIEGEQYLAIDSEGKHHTLQRQGEHLMLDGAGEPATEDEENDMELLDIVWIGVLPEIERPTTL